jgi:hypothetical protein
MVVVRREGRCARPGHPHHLEATWPFPEIFAEAMIVLSGLYAFYRERNRHRPVAADASGPPPEGL